MMLDDVIGIDVRHEGGGDDGDGGAGARGWDGGSTPRHWEVEGRGGALLVRAGGPTVSPWWAATGASLESGVPDVASMRTHSPWTCL